MPYPLKRSHLVLVAMLSPCVSEAEPPVLFDGDNVIVLDGKKPESTSSSHGQSLVPKKAVESFLPLAVDGITLGLFDRYQSNLPQLSNPICVIGSDDSSLSWLVTYKDQLIKLNASCLLVEAQNEESLARVAHFSDGLSVIPDVTGISVSKLGLARYPALVSNQWIEQ